MIKKPFKLKTQVVPEKLIENQILTMLWFKKIFAWKNQSIGVFDPVRKIYRKSNNKFHINGVSDILGILPGGRWLAIEVKSAVGKLSPDQILFIENINKMGGLAMVARSHEEVEARLKLEGVIQ